MSDWNNPALTSTYTSFLDGLKARDVEAAALFATDAGFTISNWPAKAVRYNATQTKFQRRNAANNGWENLTLNLPEAVEISDNLTVTGAITGASIDVSGKSEAGYFNTTATTVPANGINEPSSNVLGLCSNSAVRWCITGNILHKGTSALVTSSVTAMFQVNHPSGPTIALIRNDTDVNADNYLGRIIGYGNDTTSNNYMPLASVLFRGDGTHSAGDNPTRIEFQTTADGSETIRTVGCFDEAGQLAIGADVGNAPSYPLHVNGGSTQNLALFASTGASANILLTDTATTTGHVRIKSVGNNLHLHSNSSTTPSAIFNQNKYLLMGHTATLPIGSNNALIQASGTGSGAAINLSRWSADTTAPQLRFGKSRGGIGTQTALLNGDDIGRILYYGSDGTDTTTATFQIIVDVDGSVANPTDYSGVTIPIATGSVPTRFSLSNTPIGATSSRTFLQADNWGHWRLTPKANDGNHNEYCVDLRSHNSGGAGNMIRFSDTDTSATTGQIVGGLEFRTSDSGAVPTDGVLGRFIVDEDDATPHGRMKFIVGGSLRSIIHGNTGYFGIGSNENPTHNLHVTGTTRSTQGFLAGDSSSFINYGNTSLIQTGGNGANEATISAGIWTDSTGEGGRIYLCRARSSGSLTFNDAANGLHSGDVIGLISFRGSDGTSATPMTGAQIFATATEDWSDGSRGSELNFQTSNNGSTTSTKMVLRPDGKLIIGDSSGNDFWSTNSDGKLQVIDSTGPRIILARNDSSVQNNNLLGEIAFTDDDPGGEYGVNPSVRILAEATQAHSATARGSRLEIFTTRNTTTTNTRRLTISHDGSWGVGATGTSYGAIGDVLCKDTDGTSKYPAWKPVGARCWGNINGTNTPAEFRNEYNLSGVVRNATGKYTVTIDDDISAGNYVVVTMAGNNDWGANEECRHCTVSDIDTGSFKITTKNNDANDNLNASIICVAVFAD